MKQYSFLELEVLIHGTCDVARLDRKGDGQVSLLQNIIDLEVANDTARSVAFYSDIKGSLFIELRLRFQHVKKVSFKGC